MEAVACLVGIWSGVGKSYGRSARLAVNSACRLHPTQHVDYKLEATNLKAISVEMVQLLIVRFPGGERDRRSK
jgi:hypothetical protein